MAQEIPRLEKILEEMLDFARPVGLDLQAVSVNDLVESSLEVIEAKIREKGILVQKNLSNKMPKGKTAQTAEQDINVEMLRKILSHMDLKSKAITLVLASSGMRPEEPFNVVLSDVVLSATPAEIVVRGETSKEGDTRSVFVSGEATEVLRE